MKHATNSDSIENAVAYIHGRIEKEIEAFALSLGIPAQLLTLRMAELLYTSGQRHTHTVSLLWKQTRQLNSSSVGKVEMVSNSRDDMQQKTKTKKVHGVKNKHSGARAYWSKMTPEQRSVEMNRRIEIRKKNQRHKTAA